MTLLNRFDEQYANFDRRFHMGPFGRVKYAIMVVFYCIYCRSGCKM